MISLLLFLQSVFWHARIHEQNKKIQLSQVVYQFDSNMLQLQVQVQQQISTIDQIEELKKDMLGLLIVFVDKIILRFFLQLQVTECLENYYCVLGLYYFCIFVQIVEYGKLL
eukprot:TRINITY_DN52_c0_g1_i1.p5 TRINITY_DN52_c0_g1~~TRINITY_DN52_c0_g1_i1.p5  ORF type:complete len:112 (-),score=0.28 TRINITY_DN52_c0_g1_i1:110-445(-)